MEIVYAKHARAKFEVMRRHGFVITEAQVTETVVNPESSIVELGGRTTAQRRISDLHILRVIYRREADKFVVITFYPGRRARYENQL